MSQISKIQHKFKKAGRWTEKQNNLFEILLQTYGKNWDKLAQHLTNRSKQQIRSHAQKYFKKAGKEKQILYEQKAKILQVLEIMNDLKQQKKQLKNDNIQIQNEISIKQQIKQIEVKQEEQQKVTNKQKQQMIIQDAVFTNIPNQSNKTDIQNKTLLFYPIYYNPSEYQYISNNLYYPTYNQ